MNNEDKDNPLPGNKFRKKPLVVTAMTFDELVAYGKYYSTGVNGMPWSFKINGRAITHENDDCYLISTLEGVMKFHRGDMLIIGVKGEAYPCRKDIFEATYEPYIDGLYKEVSYACNT